MIKRALVALAILGVIPSLCLAISNDDFFQLKRAQRRIESPTVKGAVREFDLQQSWPSQTNNGDESRYANLRGNFGKGLNHFGSGFIQPASFNSLVTALQSGTPSVFDVIQIGGTRKLVNPQGSFAYSLAGTDGWRNALPPAPQFTSAQAAGEMVEVYWTVLCRDVNFNDFDTDATVASAVADLNTLSDFRGPKVGGVVTSGTFLRGNTAGDLIGPYISQFLYQTIPYGRTTIGPEQSVPTQSTANDFNHTFTDWFTVVNGGSTGNTTTYDPTAHFLRTPRDLAEYVHADYPGQAAFNAALILLSYGNSALDPANPYISNATQDGFVTFGVGQVLSMVLEAVEEGLKAAWFHKWQVNRRCRPEEYGFYVQQQVDGTPLGISSELIDSSGLAAIQTAFSGSSLLPVAYPEGSPTHPSYPAGHAVLMGAAVTILKAFFDEDFEIPNPLEPNAANDTLVAYGGTLTVGNELNKLAANIALGRDHAGVHYRSDGWQGMLLGEQVAIDILNNTSFLFNENFSGFTLTKFEGGAVTVGGKRSP